MKLVNPFLAKDNVIVVDDAGDLMSGDVLNVEQESMLVTSVYNNKVGVAAGYLARSPYRESKDHAEGTECLLVFRPWRGGAF